MHEQGARGEGVMGLVGGRVGQRDVGREKTLQKHRFPEACGIALHGCIRIQGEYYVVVWNRRATWVGVGGWNACTTDTNHGQALAQEGLCDPGAVRHRHCVEGLVLYKHTPSDGGRDGRGRRKGGVGVTQVILAAMHARHTSLALVCVCVCVQWTRVVQWQCGLST
jgi:hypothetical protein